MNLSLRALVKNKNHSETTNRSFDLCTASGAGLLRYHDSDSLSPDNSPEDRVELNLDSNVSPTPSHQLSLSQEMLEPELEEIFHRDLGAEDEGSGALV